MLKNTLIFLGFLGSFNCFSATNENLSINSTNIRIFEVTAYCSCEKCCGKWAKYNKTTNNQTPKQGITCAAPRNIPFNTKIHIQNIGTRIVQDRLATKYDHRIDIYFTNHNDALRFGKQELKVEIDPGPNNR